MRTALEEALGVRFQGDRGLHFFHSTLVQTLFYGLFSAWVLWSQADPTPHRLEESDLRIRLAYRRLASAGADPASAVPATIPTWPAATARPRRTARLDRSRLGPGGPACLLRPASSEGEAVPYFYEPFLEAFDPELRKQLGVWYTPTEVVRYMVARVDRALKDDLDIPDGLAAENVYVLDPCCGTGAYLAEVLRRIATNLQDQGLGALAGSRVKEAATEAPVRLRDYARPLRRRPPAGRDHYGGTRRSASHGRDRAGAGLPHQRPDRLGTEQQPKERPCNSPSPELAEERDRAEQVKQERPILVILGNPPYNGFAGMATDPKSPISEERKLSEAYRSTKNVRPPEGQGLNDLYVRFFRMAERRIAEQSWSGCSLLHLQLLLARRTLLHPGCGSATSRRSI